MGNKTFVPLRDDDRPVRPDVERDPEPNFGDYEDSSSHDNESRTRLVVAGLESDRPEVLDPLIDTMGSFSKHLQVGGPLDFLLLGKDHLGLAQRMPRLELGIENLASAVVRRMHSWVRDPYRSERASNELNNAFAALRTVAGLRPSVVDALIPELWSAIGPFEREQPIVRHLIRNLYNMNRDIARDLVAPRSSAFAERDAEEEWGTNVFWRAQDPRRYRLSALFFIAYYAKPARGAQLFESIFNESEQERFVRCARLLQRYGKGYREDLVEGAYLRIQMSRYRDRFWAASVHSCLRMALDVLDEYSPSELQHPHTYMLFRIWCHGREFAQGIPWVQTSAATLIGTARRDGTIKDTVLRKFKREAVLPVPNLYRPPAKGESEAE